jgi:hypothetical protein
VDKTESVKQKNLKNFVRKFVEKIYKLMFLEGKGVPVLTYRTQGA